MSSEVEVRRSARRKRTVSAYQRDGKIVVMIPAHFTRAQEQEYVDSMVERLSRRGRRDRSDDALQQRADELNERYLDGLAKADSVRWVDNMRSRWGSCTSVDRSIRISSRVRDLPDWVSDYVLVHELAHLLEPNHSKAFWAWVERYPRAERARGFLEGVSHGLPD